MITFIVGNRRKQRQVTGVIRRVASLESGVLRTDCRRRADDRWARYYNALHARAVLAEDYVDDLADRLGAGLLAAVWGTELSLFLRHRECSDRSRLVAGERAGFFLGCLRTANFSKSLHNCSCGGVAGEPAFHRRHEVHVRSEPAFIRSAAEFVSCHHAAAATVGDLAAGL